MFALLALVLTMQSEAELPPPPPLAAMVPSEADNLASYLAAEDAAAAVNATLDRLHKAASEADEETYFAQFAVGARFLGTDATERWDMGQFRLYANPIFASGRGWTFRPRPDRALMINGDTVIFDELLDSDSYGLVRGSGVLTRWPDGWKIEQYVLSFTVPNDKARAVVDVIGPPAPYAPEDGAEGETAP